MNSLSTSFPKPSLKIRTASAIFWNYLGIFRDYGLKNIFFRNKTFLFFKIESFSIGLKKNFVKPHKISTHSAHSDSCLIELKFCEVSRNSFSNRCWKFQLSIFRNKKVLFLKKIELSQEWTGCNIKTTSFVYWPNFQQRFCLEPPS